MSTGTRTDRRGQPPAYVSYWSHRERNLRAEVFLRHARGERVPDIAAAVQRPESEIQAILRTDRRRSS